ncbi:MAG: TraB/GumN family protein, partial [Xanthomonas sp.]|nr:TraB/GumN family protein [Xanthomonas sp.]
LIEHELPQAAVSARAWAVGDWTAIRNAARIDERAACDSAWLDTETARKHGVRDIDTRVRTKWLETAEASLRRNRITFATMSVWNLVKPDGYLAALQAKGYEIEAPE